MAEGHGDPHLAHHFDTPQQQFEAGKLGMWLFLATEVLLFGGLFCAYAVYRANHPEIFQYAHHFLDKTLGGINTIVLIASSFTMAMAVRFAQIGDQKKLKLCLALTLLGAFGFLGIKAVEYEHKWKHGLLWGKHYRSQESASAKATAEGPASAKATAESADAEPGKPAAEPEADPSAVAPAGAEAEAAPPKETGKTSLTPPAVAPTGMRDPDEKVVEEKTEEAPKNVHIFFGIYFVMTGLHGLHVIAGMVIIIWLLKRSVAGHFGPHYYTPVDLGGLYWHIVDVIWIFLFPLLYLIH